MTFVGDILELAYGKALKESDRDGGLVAVVGSGGVVGGHSRGITEAPTIVVGRKGSIGSVTWIDGPAWPIDTAYFVKSRRKDMDQRWAYWMLKSLGMESMNKSAAVPGLNRDDVYRLKVEVPSPGEQRRIAAILDHADALRAKRRQVLIHLDALTRSLFYNMFGSQDWPREALGDRLQFLTSGSRGWAKYYASTGDKFIRIQNVKGGYLEQTDMAYVIAPDSAEARRTAVQAHDVLLSITADLGRTAVVPDDIGRAYISQHLALLRAPSLTPRYLADFLASPAGQREILGKNRGATKAGLNFDDVRSVSVPVPPADLQARYAEQVERVDTQRGGALTAQAAWDQLFASLQASAFRGEL